MNLLLCKVSKAQDILSRVKNPRGYLQRVLNHIRKVEGWDTKFKVEYSKYELSSVDQLARPRSRNHPSALEHKYLESLKEKIIYYQNLPSTNEFRFKKVSLQNNLTKAQRIQSIQNTIAKSSRLRIMRYDVD